MLLFCRACELMILTSTISNRNVWNVAQSTSELSILSRFMEFGKSDLYFVGLWCVTWWWYHRCGWQCHCGRHENVLRDPEGSCWAQWCNWPCCCYVWLVQTKLCLAWQQQDRDNRFWRQRWPRCSLGIAVQTMIWVGPMKIVYGFKCTRLDVVTYTLI